MVEKFKNVNLPELTPNWRRDLVEKFKNVNLPELTPNWRRN